MACMQYTWHPNWWSPAAPWHDQVADVGAHADAGGLQSQGSDRPRLLPTDNAALVADAVVHGGGDGASAAACRPPALVSFQDLAAVPAAVLRQPTTSAWWHTAD